jgi:Ran GTPase-activating protein (RanGAP) involved in mRNA processing and transport
MNLHSNGIGDDGVRAIVEVLKTNSFLQEIHLWGNKISDEGDSTIPKALKTNTAIQEINLR